MTKKIGNTMTHDLSSHINEWYIIVQKCYRNVIVSSARGCRQQSGQIVEVGSGIRS